MRSLLFLPGNTPNMLINADILGADGIILDLEDAVSPNEKDAARLLTRHAIGEMGFSCVSVAVRVNGLDSPYWQDDLQAVVPVRPDYILLPKVNSAQDIHTLESAVLKLEESFALPQNAIRFLPLLETALGVENAFLIAVASPRIAGLLLGGEDLSADLLCERTITGNELLYARGRLVVAARAANVEVYDTPFTDVADDAGAYADAQYAKSLGFTGKLCISPRHVRGINQAFSPTPLQIQHAKEVLLAVEEAQKAGKGAISLHGKMIDAPIVARAKTLLDTANRLEGRSMES